MTVAGAQTGTPPWRGNVSGGTPRKHDVRFAKLVVILNGVVPGLMLAWDALHHQIGANGVNYALHTTGLLSFIFLLLSLLVTPLRKLTGWNTLISFRRALGLYGFFYACSHFLIFFVFDRALGVQSTVHEILFRRYLQIGTAGLLLMVPLAFTSTNAMVMRLGAKRWKGLHRLTYGVAIAAAVHYYLLVKSDVRQPLAFAAAVAVLLGYRVVRYAAGRGQARQRAAARMARAPLAEVGVLAGAAVQGAKMRSPSAAAKPRYWSGELRVARVFDETPDVRTFRLVAEDGGPLPFDHQPGQYLNLALTIGGKRVNRSYTIASSPTRGHYCEVTVKRSATGHGSWHLHDSIPAGSKLKVSAPAGRFFFTGAPVAGGAAPDKVVLIAGGVGITPLMSMIRYLTDRCWAGQIYLIFSVRKQADLIFQDELTYLERRFPNLHLCLTLTKEEGADWRGARGAISGELLERFVPGLRGAPVYLCGPDPMMAAMRELLGRLGVPADAIHTEAFVSPPASSDVAPSVSDAALLAATAQEGEAAFPGGVGPLAESILAKQTMQVQFRRSRQVVGAPAGQTILETAEAAGVDLPFECRSGICGQCKVRLVAGRVIMEAEDALGASEKATGLILACQARPTDDVTVDA